MGSSIVIQKKMGGNPSSLWLESFGSCRVAFPSFFPLLLGISRSCLLAKLVSLLSVLSTSVPGGSDP